MSLKVNKGQKITALHSNKIVDAICALEHKPNSVVQKNDYLDSLEQIPVFSFCWVQSNNDLVVYVNTQNNPNNIVFNGDKPIEYCSLDYQLPESELDLTETINSEYLTNVSYLAVKTIDTTCTAEQPINLSIVQTESNELYYTFNNDSLEGCSNVIRTVPIGVYNNYTIRQIHEGLINYSDNQVVVDSELSSLNLKTINQKTSEEDDKKYLTLFNSENGFSSPLTKPDGEQKNNLRTLMLFNNCDETVLDYGKAEDYFILNDISGYENGTYVLPKQLSSFCDLTIGKNGCNEYHSTLYFENPLRTEVVETECEVTGILESGNYVLTISAENNISPVQACFKEFRPTEVSSCGYIEVTKVKNNFVVHGPEIVIACDSKIKGSMNYNSDENKWTLSLEDNANTICLKGEKNICVNYCNDTLTGLELYSILGPNINITCTDTVAGTATYNQSSNTWELSLNATTEQCGGCETGPTYSAGSYITISDDNKINGASINITCTDTVAGTATYNQSSNTWELSLNACSSCESGPTYSAGCYIAISDSNTINGAGIDVEVLTDECYVESVITWNENSNRWLIKLFEPIFSINDVHQKKFTIQSVPPDPNSSGEYKNAKKIEICTSTDGVINLFLDDAGERDIGVITPDNNIVMSKDSTEDNVSLFRFTSSASTGSCDGCILKITGDRDNGGINFNINTTQLADEISDILDICSGGSTPVLPDSFNEILCNLENNGWVTSIQCLTGEVTLCSSDIYISTLGNNINLQIDRCAIGLNNLQNSVYQIETKLNKLANYFGFNWDDI